MVSKKKELPKGWQMYDEKTPFVRVYYKKDGTVKFKIAHWDSAAKKHVYLTLDLPDRLRTKKETIDWLRVEHARMIKGMGQGHAKLSPRMTFSEYFEDHFISEREVRTKTREEYQRQYDAYIKRYIGYMRLDEITIESLNEFIRQVSAEIRSKYRTSSRQYSGNSCCNAMIRLIKAVLNQALEDNLIDRNPAMSQRIRLMPGEQQKRPLTDEEFRAFLNAEQTPYWHALIWTMACTGCRRSEIAGLMWKNVDLDEFPHISVVQSVCSTANGIEINSPKTKKSWRHIPIPKMLVDILKDYKSQCLSDKFVFPNANDPEKPISPDTITAHIKNLGDSLGFENISPHMFRSYAATKMICSGANEMMVQKITGHTNADTIKDYYLKMDHEEGLTVVKSILDK